MRRRHQRRRVALPTRPCRLLVWLLTWLLTWPLTWLCRLPKRPCRLLVRPVLLRRPCLLPWLRPWLLTSLCLLRWYARGVANSVNWRP